MHYQVIQRETIQSGHCVYASTQDYVHLWWSLFCIHCALFTLVDVDTVAQETCQVRTRGTHHVIKRDTPGMHK